MKNAESGGLRNLRNLKPENIFKWTNKWKSEVGYWIGEFALLGSDGNPYISSKWNYYYDHYKGFITGNVKGWVCNHYPIGLDPIQNYIRLTQRLYYAMPSTSLRVEALLYRIMVIISISSVLLLHYHLLAREFKRGYGRVSDQSVIQSVLQFYARHSPPIYL